MENFNALTATLTGPASPAPAAAGGKNVRVWLVDDNEQLRVMVAELLDQLGGIECARQFSSPDELLSTLASKPGPDVILLDVQMGDHNGLDAVRPIRSLTRDTRVFMFTTCYNETWQERALEEGASGYLLKSDAMERVAERIRTAAHDPAPALVGRRRLACSVAEPRVTYTRTTDASATNRLPLLSRTLRMFGLLAN